MKKEKTFYKPTNLLKELTLLRLISKDNNITQRQISKVMGIPVSSVNVLLDRFENEGFLKREYSSIKNVAYNITSNGNERLKLLSMDFLKSSLDIYNIAKEEIVTFFSKIAEKGFRSVILYGAGEVAELILHVVNNEVGIKTRVVAIIDDDRKKQGRVLFKCPVVSFDDRKAYGFNGILVTSYTHREIVTEKIIKEGIEPQRILNFFEGEK